MKSQKEGLMESVTLQNEGYQQIWNMSVYLFLQTET